MEMPERFVVIHSMDPGSQSFKLPEKNVTSYHALETYIHGSFGKLPAYYNLHVHYRKRCTGQNELDPPSFDKQIEVNNVVPSTAIELHFYVCFIQKSQLPLPDLPRHPLGRLENTVIHPTSDSTSNSTKKVHNEIGTDGANKNDRRVVINTLRHVEQRLGTTQGRGRSAPPSVNVSSQLLSGHLSSQIERLRVSPPGTGMKRSSEESSAPECSKRPRPTISRDQAGVAAVLVGSPDVEAAHPPLGTYGTVQQSSTLAEESLRQPCSPLPGSAARPYSISSRESPVTSQSTSPPSPRPRAPVDNHKVWYEFLLSKRVPSRDWFTVGVLYRSKAPEKFDLPEEVSALAVAARLVGSSTTRRRVFHYVLDRDPDGNEVPMPRIERISLRFVDYFPEIADLKKGNAIVAFMARYFRSLLHAVPYERASIIDLGDDDDDDEYTASQDETSVGDAYQSMAEQEKFEDKNRWTDGPNMSAKRRSDILIVALQVPKESLARLRDQGRLRDPVSTRSDANTDNPVRSKYSGDSSEVQDVTRMCYRCRIDGKKCKPTGLKNNVGCARCIVQREWCSLIVSPDQTRPPMTQEGKSTVEDVRAESTALTRELSSPDDEDEGQKASDQPSLRTDYGNGESTPWTDFSGRDSAKHHVAQYLRGDEPLSGLPHGLPHRTSENNIRREAGNDPEQPRNKPPEEQLANCWRSLESDYNGLEGVNLHRNDRHVRVNFTFTDVIDGRDPLIPLNFQKRGILLRRDWKPSEVIHDVVDIIDMYQLETKGLAASERKDYLTNLDFVVTASPGPGQRPWIKSWQLVAADTNPDARSLLMRYGGQILDLNVEIWSKGRQRNIRTFWET